MNLITVIIIGIVIWLVYSLINSYRSLEKELREIRAKCMAQPQPQVSTTTPQIKTANTSSNININVNSGTQSTAQFKNKTKSGAYTPNGEEIYADNNEDKYDNDPLSSMRNSLLSGLKTAKNYAAI